MYSNCSTGEKHNKDLLKTTTPHYTIYSLWICVYHVNIMSWTKLSIVIFYIVCFVVAICCYCYMYFVLFKLLLLLLFLLYEFFFYFDLFNTCDTQIIWLFYFSFCFLFIYSCSVVFVVLIFIITVAGCWLLSVLSSYP